MKNENVLYTIANRNKSIDPRTYHNAKQLLQIYSDIVWNNVEAYTNVLKECNETYGLPSYRGLEILAEIGEEEKAIELKERLMSVAENKIMIDAIKRALLHLREYKHNGELYYDIIYKNYFVKYKHTEDELLEMFKMSRSTYYRKREDAVYLFGVSLWGLIIPNVLESFDHKHSETKMILN
ncbi:hypothetical protein [Vallitalea guaymasensis]|uniref:hypothetical protein n=1 Tax=Vallitalea guaymasensis TaxID=1185412 RepID=UPI0023543D47|nr:hypothetical protein [Vallitalea guaymasensis]